MLYKGDVHASRLRFAHFKSEVEVSVKDFIITICLFASSNNVFFIRSDIFTCTFYWSMKCIIFNEILIDCCIQLHFPYFCIKHAIFFCVNLV